MAGRLHAAVTPAAPPRGARRADARAGRRGGRRGRALALRAGLHPSRRRAGARPRAREGREVARRLRGRGGGAGRGDRRRGAPDRRLPRGAGSLSAPPVLPNDAAGERLRRAPRGVRPRPRGSAPGRGRASAAGGGAGGRGRSRRGSCGRGGVPGGRGRAATGAADRRARGAARAADPGSRRPDHLRTAVPLRGKGALAIWNGIAPDGEDDFYRWHNTEHIPERVGVPGFLRGRRYLSTARPRDFFTLYETESAETIRSAPYLARLNDPTPWTRRVLPHFRDTFRLGCRVAASWGRGEGGALLALRLAGRGKGLLDSAEARLALVRQLTGVVGVHLLAPAR